VRARLDKDPTDVTQMFASVAPRYDLMNDLASLGQDRRWRVDVVDALAPQPGEVILDLAAGTGTSSVPISRAGATVISTDLTEDMVRVGRERHPEQVFVVGDAAHLPYEDGCFDAATMSFGLRNVADAAHVLTELHRVVRSGGTLVVCEFSTPTSAVMRAAYRVWLNRGMPVMAQLASSDVAAYSYLTESILAWPDQEGLAAMMEAAGWEDIQWRNLTGGVVALHRATRP
jgi:demethylmenaquinone methyltransferase/2-methoxy-6-polyprenyl-1,4-benzoquinol methylase